VIGTLRACAFLLTASRPLHEHIYSCLFFSGLIVSCLSANIIVDDADPGWTFSGKWNAITPSERCSGCIIQPDPSRVYDGTWHETSDDEASAELSFTGVSIRIYAIRTPDIGSWKFVFNFSLAHDGIRDYFFLGLAALGRNMSTTMVFMRGWISRTALMWLISQTIL
jgi:hypothetical protein